MLQDLEKYSSVESKRYCRRMVVGRFGVDQGVKSEKKL